MKRVLRLVTFLFAFSALPALAATLGKPAPDFALPDLSGKTVELSSLKGRYVVLEWVNPECPYVRKHYNSGNMPALQKEFGAKSVAWLSINSTNAGHREFKSPGEMSAWMKEKGGSPTATLIDRDSKVGRVYGARTTPHMYVIDPSGVLIYAGAIDDRRSTSVADVKTAKNYVRAALGEALEGKPVSTASTPPYGCTVKY
jgi:AhpC/TSA family